MIKSSSWNEALADFIKSDEYKVLLNNVEEEYTLKAILPCKENVFRALDILDFDKVKVVILGQDPYPNKQHAMGLSFSVPIDASIPKSLVNIFKEYNDDLGYPIPLSGDLSKWSKEGVLLLNTSLTVEEGKPGSHSTIGWTLFTDEIIRKISNRGKVVFLLWGNHAKSKKELIDIDRNRIIESVHPSPLAAYRGFFGSKPFSSINTCLKELGQEEIDFKLE